MSDLIINASLPETRIALIEDGEVQELLVERPSEKGIVGNIYKGKVSRVLPGMQAAFVDIGLEKSAFLYVDDIYVHREQPSESADDGVEVLPPEIAEEVGEEISHELEGEEGLLTDEDYEEDDYDTEAEGEGFSISMPLPASS